MTARIVQDHAGTEKADTGQDSLDDAADRVLVGDKRAVRRAKDSDRGDSSAQADERVSPKTGGLPVQFAVQSDNRADHERGAKTQSSFFVWGEHLED